MKPAVKYVMYALILALLVWGVIMVSGWNDYKKKWEAEHSTNTGTSSQTCNVGYSPDFAPINVKQIEPYGSGK